MPFSTQKFRLAFFFAAAFLARPAAADERHLLYVATPGIRNQLEFGGAGVLVFDMDKDHAFVRRIETPAGQRDKPENVKGVCACAATGKLYFTTLTKLYCLDLRTDKTLWEKALPGGCDRLAIRPDGTILYVPSLEGPHWNVVDGASGDLITKVEPKSGAHNTVCGLDGKHFYLAGLKSPLLRVTDPNAGHKIVREIGPFGAAIRPFTVNAAQTLCFVNVNGLLGFEIGDLKTGKLLQRVEVKGFEKGPVKRHGCPSHGIGLTPDEKEIWLCDGHNSRLHVFDNTVMPPKQITDIPLREQPGWVTFSLDGRRAYPSTGEVIDTKTRKIVAALKDEKGRAVHSEKMVEIVFRDGAPVRAGDQFGVGRAAGLTVTVETEGPAEVQAWAARAKKIVEEWHPRVAALLPSEGFTPPMTVKLVFKKQKDGIAAASGNTITFNTDYLAKHPDDWGLVVHELTHVIQAYPNSDPGWLTEGIADYIRLYHFEPETARPRIDPKKASYRDGYRTTAAFLAWLEKTHDKPIVAKLNRAMRRKEFKEELFRDYTGKSVDQLWNDFVKSGKK